jgi:cytochrome c oxidase cbb3-type subunit 3
MRIISRTLYSILLLALLDFGIAAAQKTTQSKRTGAEVKPKTSAASSAQSSQLVQKGSALFRQNCSFCHGRDATGGESGPDLTRSRLVREDTNGDKIGPVIRSGRPEKGMPRFELTGPQIASLVAFVHAQQFNARNRKGGRKGVDPSDLQTGNAQAGQEYFNGAGGCASCHSPTGDLAGVASRYIGLQLEEQMLYPKQAKSTVTVTVPSGQTMSGTLAYLDEFTVALRDATGQYHSWRTRDVQVKIVSPAEAHLELMGKYTDDDVHNLMAYLQTLK